MTWAQPETNHFSVIALVKQYSHTCIPRIRLTTIILQHLTQKTYITIKENSEEKKRSWSWQNRTAVKIKRTKTRTYKYDREQKKKWLSLDKEGGEV